MSLLHIYAAYEDGRVDNITDVAVLVALAKLADPSGICIARMSEVARMCRCAVRTVIRSVKSLEDAGVIYVSRTPGTENVYRLLIDVEPYRKQAEMDAASMLGLDRMQ